MTDGHGRSGRSYAPKSLNRVTWSFLGQAIESQPMATVSATKVMSMKARSLASPSRLMIRMTHF